MSRFPTRFQQKTLWNAATGLGLLVLGALLVGFTWLVGQMFGFLQPVLIPLLIAGVIAYLLDPVVVWLEKRGMKRLWAVMIVFFALLLTFGGMAAALVPGIKSGKQALQKVFQPNKQAPQDSPDDDKHLIPQLVSSLRKLRSEHPSDPIGWALTEVDDHDDPVAKPSEAETLEFLATTRVGRMFFENKDTILSTGRSWLSTGTSKVLAFLGLVLGMIMVPVYLFFFLKESAAIRDHWHDYVPLKASRFKTELVDCLKEINGYLISFFRGQVLVALIDGVLVGIGLTIYGLPYGLLVGAFMAILGVIPYIGNILCLVPACIIGYLHAQGVAPWGLGPTGYVIGVVAIFVGVQQINSLVTAPKIVGDSVGLHPLTVIFSMLFWSLVLGGFVGALLAVPLTAAVKVLFRRYIWERQLKEDAETAGVPRMFDD
ncbi:AI-2E family transporter [Luteolibacter sp. LG18]|uniref:AI-2E family transporter n=1 Tax=Luteolibacter sp. LG18 TaxID=2819286 RepID=UPI002B313D20|nr:AI-2E family transporter [Luteolibacter sp. LG18]